MADIENTSIEDPELFKAWMSSKAVQSNRKRVVAKMLLLPHHGLAWGTDHVRHVDGNLHELKVMHYRLYFRYEKPTARFVWYGTKGTQQADIQKAQGIE
ncbi:MAG: hypothetical protein JWM86_2356 [Thermoleophilia bacterium]|nr:hypothetical protein [Thermoleophilia bacterium]